MSLVLKLLGGLVSIGAGLAASQVLAIVWKRVTGQEAPKSDDDLENSLPAAIIFAVVSGIVLRVVQVLTKRATAKAVIRFDKTRDMV